MGTGAFGLECLGLGRRGDGCIVAIFLLDYWDGSMGSLCRHGVAWRRAEGEDGWVSLHGSHAWDGGFWVAEGWAVESLNDWFGVTAVLILWFNHFDLS